MDKLLEINNLKKYFLIKGEKTGRNMLRAVDDITLDIYKGGVWQPIGNPEDHSNEAHPLSVDPIVEQVARIALPQFDR